MAPRALTRLLLLAGLPGLSGAVQLQSEASSHAAMLSVKQQYRTKILKRFAHADSNGDGSVSLAELKAGYGHAPAHAGVKILNNMLTACTGGAKGGAESCSRQQMEATLESWVSSHHTSKALSLLQADSNAGFKELHGEGGGEPCGASINASATIGGVQCFWEGSKCFEGNPVLAWVLHDVCDTRGCICDAKPETKRLAKLGLTGALAVTTAKNFSDPTDIMSPPACGGGWSATKLVANLDHLNQRMGELDKLVMAFAAPHMLPEEASQKMVKEIDTDETEVGFFKSAEHQLTRGGPMEKVCMFSWQATRSIGDWKTNLLSIDTDFTYSKHAPFRVAKGIVWAYESSREMVKQVFEKECCTPDFTVRKLIISGHSHGGALAELHAVDAVTNWQCNGRDLGADDISLVSIAPHSNMLPMAALNNVFSCGDKANCLAGSVVTLTTKGDLVGDASFSEQVARAPRHPSVVTRLECPPILPDSKVDTKWWCHGIFNYMSVIEDAVVDQAGWGSSCGGECGNVNRQVQCNQVVIIGQRACDKAPPEYLKTPTACDSKKSWNAAKEKCECHIDHCSELHTLVCAA